MAACQKVIIWNFLDGRPGHENQVLGLTDSICRRFDCEIHNVQVGGRLRGCRAILPGRLRSLAGLPSPDLLIGAGHATHIPLLCCRSRFGGRTVVIMKPSLPLALFDLCLVPHHDRLWGSHQNTIRFDGALNRIRPSQTKDDHLGLILIGGTSRHFQWSSEFLMHQISSVVSESPDVRWTIATSERTPAGFVSACRRHFNDVSVVTPTTSGRNWLIDQLSAAGAVWVTCDSVSMIYESMTAGARPGLLEMPTVNSDRVVQNVDRLVKEGLAVRWSDVSRELSPGRSAQIFSEADRCAAEVVQRLLTTDPRLSMRASMDRTVPVSVNLNPLM